MEFTFGELYRRLTSSALHLVQDRVATGGSIVDFGAGCGRLALPLQALGYDVTAVEPSGPMAAELRRRSGDALKIVQAPMRQYRSGDRHHDCALCVFTVVAYLLDPAELRASFEAAASCLRPGGLFLVDIPHHSVFEGFEVETGEIIRNVEFAPLSDSSYTYSEKTVLRTADGQVSFEDRFTLRRWRREEIEEALDAAGFEAEAEVDETFSGFGADYVLMRRREG